jgi:hypothetical protein
MKRKSKFSCLWIVDLRAVSAEVEVTCRGWNGRTECDPEPRFKCHPEVVDNQLGKSTPSTSISSEFSKVRPASSNGWR